MELDGKLHSQHLFVWAKSIHNTTILETESFYQIGHLEFAIVVIFLLDVHTIRDFSCLIMASLTLVVDLHERDCFLCL